MLTIIAFTSIAQDYAEILKVTASKRELAGYFGRSVAMYEDYAVIGSPNENYHLSETGSINNAGAVYVFKRQETGSWKEVQKLLPSIQQKGAKFGTQLAIHDNYICITAPEQNTITTTNDTILKTGALFVFKLNKEDKWEETQVIHPKAQAYCLAGKGEIFIDSGTLAVGIPHHDTVALDQLSIYNSGIVYMYELSDENLWVQSQKIIPSTLEDHGFFGNHLVISGNTLMASAKHETHPSRDRSPISYQGEGTVYVFEKNNNGIWEEKQKIWSSDYMNKTKFGNSLSLEEDILVVGKYLSESAYIFIKNKNGAWEEKQKIQATDMHHAGYFGSSVLIEDETIYVGAKQQFRDIDQQYRGAVYVFKMGELDLWEQKQKLYPSTPSVIGDKMAVANNVLLLGDYYNYLDVAEKDSIRLAGAAHFFSTEPLLDNEELGFSSIQTLNDNNEFTIVPNPVESILYLNHNGVIIKKLNILTTQGIPLKMLEGNITQIDLTDFPTGIYILQTESDKGIQTQRFTKE